MTNFPLDVANDYVLTGDNMPGGFCSTVELCVGILAACIATWRPLFNRAAHHSAISTASSGRLASKSPSLGISTRAQPEQIKMTVKPNGMISRVGDNEDKERLYARMPEAMEDPVDERW